MLTPDIITAASADPGALDMTTLEAAFDAFALYPHGEQLSGFTGPDHMLTVFTDGVAVHLVGDFNPLPEAVVEALLEYAATHHGTLLGFTYRDGAVLATARWQGFRDRFAA